MEKNTWNIKRPNFSSLLSAAGWVILILVFVGDNPVGDWVYELLEEKYVWTYNSQTISISLGGIKIFLGIVIMNLMIYFYWKRKAKKEGDSINEEND